MTAQLDAASRSDDLRGYSGRHLIERAMRPEISQAFAQLMAATFGGSTSLQLKNEVFTVASLATGCRHCQAHGAYALSLLGTETERVRALWEFETSPLFDDHDRAALRFAREAAKAPSEVTPAHHAELRKHYSDAEIADLLAVVCLAGWLNRFNDSLATVTDQESVDWARQNLGDLGWSLGKHQGSPEEQRPGHPLTLMRRSSGE